MIMAAAATAAAAAAAVVVVVVAITILLLARRRAMMILSRSRRVKIRMRPIPRGFISFTATPQGYKNRLPDMEIDGDEDQASIEGYRAKQSNEHVKVKQPSLFYSAL